MHSHPHATLLGSRAVRVHVVTVSTSRTPATDVSGPLIRDLLAQHGHSLAGSTLVPDDPVAITEALDALLEDGEVEAVVLTGGTGVSARDCTPIAVRARLDRELPGFGELFRMLSWEKVGPAAMLSTAIGGIAKGRPIFALPGSPEACRLALEKLILPELVHLVHEVGKEAPLVPNKGAPKAPPVKVDHQGESAPMPPEPVKSDRGVEMIGEGTARPEEPEIGTGWRAGLRGIKGEVDRSSRGEIPEAFERVAPAMDVLNAAGDRAVVKLADGRRYTAFGYPDLVRNASKVLLVRDAEPYPEVVALHRWPRLVGICAEGDDGIVPSADLDPAPIAAERTGAPYPGSGSLFAVESASIYVREGKKISTWDGRELTGGWPIASCIGTLLLHWSQR